MSPTKSTRQQLVKVAQVTCLYRHSLSGRYYGIKKVSGKRKEHALATAGRKLAERRLRKWIADLGKTDAAMEHLTLRELIAKLQKAHHGKAAKTRATEASIIRKLDETWPHDLDMRVGDVRPSHLNEWLALHEKRLKHTTSRVPSRNIARQFLGRRKNRTSECSRVGCLKNASNLIALPQLVNNQWHSNGRTGSSDSFSSIQGSCLQMER
jgi:hypothetical protein